MTRMNYNIQWLPRLGAIVLFMLVSAPAAAIEKLEVQGLFSNKAVLNVDGVMRILKVGDSSPEGVKLISVGRHDARLSVDGVQKTYTLGSAVSTTFASKKTQSETIYINSGGMYMTFGSINGRSVRFLVDTGASAIAMNKEQAKQLGIRYEKTGIPASVSTASGFTDAYRVRLKTVSIGEITESNVEAFVIDGNHPGPILLGMTFLGRLDIEHSGNALKLLQK